MNTYITETDACVSLDVTPLPSATSAHRPFAGIIVPGKSNSGGPIDLSVAYI